MENNLIRFIQFFGSISLITLHFFAAFKVSLLKKTASVVYKKVLTGYFIYHVLSTIAYFLVSLKVFVEREDGNNLMVYVPIILTIAIGVVIYELYK